MNGVKAWLGNTLWQLTAFREWVAFHAYRNRLRSTQTRLLQNLLADFSGTHYGRRFGIRADWDYQTFAKSVPTAGYEELQPFLAAASGLFHGRARVWEPTGGSVGGSKWIPWTGQLQAQFRRAVDVWIFELLRGRPEVKRGRGYWQLTPKTEVEPPEWLEGCRTGFESDGEYLGLLGKMIEGWITVGVSGQESLWERTVEALGRARDLRLLSCWSPSFLQLLQQRMTERYGYWEPRRWWPHLQLVSCWTQGPSAPFLSQLRALFPGVEIQGKGLLSTEAVTTIPLQGRYPLAYRSHFFEFEAEDGTIRPSWDLRRGTRYKVLQTTGGGLIRYQSDDWVLVTDFFGEVPCLKFLGRDRTIDRFGEKLNETYLQEALNRLEQFAVLGFEDNGYVLFLESTDNALEAHQSLDRSLRQVFTYRDCMELGQLQPLRLFVLEGTGPEQIARELDLYEGRRKPSAVLPDGVWSRRFRGRFLG